LRLGGVMVDARYGKNKTSKDGYGQLPGDYEGLGATNGVQYPRNPFNPQFP
jgi:hypothetical protein